MNFMPDDRRVNRLTRREDFRVLFLFFAITLNVRHFLTTVLFDARGFLYTNNLSRTMSERRH